MGTETHNLDESSEGARSHNCRIIVQDVDHVGYQSVELCFIREVARKSEQRIQRSQLGAWASTVAEVSANEGQDYQSRSI